MTRGLFSSNTFHKRRFTAYFVPVVERSVRVRSVICRCLLLLRFEVILTEEFVAGLNKFEACGQFRRNKLIVKRVAI